MLGRKIVGFLADQVGVDVGKNDVVSTFTGVLLLLELRYEGLQHKGLIKLNAFSTIGFDESMLLQRARCPMIPTEATSRGFTEALQVKSDGKVHRGHEAGCQNVLSVALHDSTLLWETISGNNSLHNILAILFDVFLKTNHYSAQFLTVDGDMTLSVGYLCLCMLGDYPVFLKILIVIAQCALLVAKLHGWPVSFCVLGVVKLHGFPGFARLHDALGETISGS
ncbi:hypothetical protein PHJA_001569700 [Phtheirospermum japonicum]|uniref:Uncharacterized protein n=1 Tax=Phtheirospermum japonicum TaxID=374723 RepID=A0A830C7U7_9LAMI|nr:hypothetical protein PHJA_001569700 [Phtheirospermum japonicum]